MSKPTYEELVARFKAAREADWASFRHNWPMLVFDLLVDFGGATALGVLLGLSIVLYALEVLA